MEGRAHSSLTTPNHRWPVRNRGDRNFKRRWKTSETLNMVDYIQCAAEDSGLPTEPQWSDAFVELVAWAWTEGNWNTSDALNIGQSSTVNPENCNRIREALFELMGPSHPDSMYDERYSGKSLWVENLRDHGMVYWKINKEGSKQFADVISNPEKIISYKWFRTLTKQQLDFFIEISMMADGYFEKNRLVQKSRARAEAFAFACILSGKAISFYEINNDHNQQLEIGILQRYQFAPLAHANNSDGRPFRVERIKHDGIVWCPTTPNGTWLARRKGTVYWTGNTDNETNTANSMHPFQALQQYREKTGIAAKLVVCGMTATEISIADPDDAGSIDVAGYDTNTPQVIADFIKQ